MKHSLLLLGIVAALAIGTPASSQYIYMDVNGDGQCTGADALNNTVTSVDVWIDTDNDANGTAGTCVNPAQPLDIFSYALLLHYSGTGSVTYNSWDNFMDTANGIPTTFNNLDPLKTAGADMSISYGAPPGVKVNPGTYRLGRVNVTVTGTPILSFATTNSDPNFVPFTGYGTSCDGTTFGNTMALGHDFQDACGPGSPTAIESTTWGKIKQIYR